VYFYQYVLSRICCCGGKFNKIPDLTLKEVTFLTYSGFTKGAICYGLALEVAETSPSGVYSHEMKSILHNCVLAVVILTTVFFGSFMSRVRSCLLGPAKEEKELIEKAIEKDLLENH